MGPHWRDGDPRGPGSVTARPACLACGYARSLAFADIAAFTGVQVAEKQRVAVLGLGGMGRAMAANLVRAGLPTVVWNRRQEPALLELDIDRLGVANSLAAQWQRAVEQGMGNQDVTVVARALQH
jgi:shikimate 5-dehydrogenase